MFDVLLSLCVIIIVCCYLFILLITLIGTLFAAARSVVKVELYKGLKRTFNSYYKFSKFVRKIIKINRNTRKMNIFRIRLEVNVKSENILEQELKSAETQQIFLQQISSLVDTQQIF